MKAVVTLRALLGFVVAVSTPVAVVFDIQLWANFHDPAGLGAGVMVACVGALAGGLPCVPRRRAETQHARVVSYRGLSVVASTLLRRDVPFQNQKE